MSVGSWDPHAGDAGADSGIDAQQLQQFMQWARQDQLDKLAELLGSADRQALARLMQLEAAPWLAAAASCNDEELRQLIRFFTVAENLPGCEAADKSPVIPLAKLLRQRGQRLDKDLLLWIRQVNKNRYLPYGPLT